MKISMIVAMTSDRLIGKNNKMPWHIPDELKHFKSVTTGKPIVMGRNTFESIGRPLPGRKNIVITSNTELKIEGVTVVHSIDQAIAAGDDCDELMVIGGATLYEQMLNRVDYLYVTIVDVNIIDGDAFFPEFRHLNWGISDVKKHQSFTTSTFRRIWNG